MQYVEMTSSGARDAGPAPYLDYSSNHARGADADRLSSLGGSLWPTTTRVRPTDLIVLQLATAASTLRRARWASEGGCSIRGAESLACCSGSRLLTSRHSEVLSRSRPAPVGRIEIALATLSSSAGHQGPSWRRTSWGMVPPVQEPPESRQARSWRVLGGATGPSPRSDWGSSERLVTLGGPGAEGPFPPGAREQEILS